jgi:xylulokinase
VGIDVGTTGLKAVVLDAGARPLRSHAVRYPTRLAGLGAEQDPAAWWQAARAALREVLAPGEPVAAVAVTSQGPTLVALDDAGEPTGPALTWIDRRATAEAREVAMALAGAGAADRAGRNGSDPYFGTSKLLWWSRRGGLDRAAAVLCANSYLAFRLTGATSFEESTAGFFTGWDGAFDPALRDLGVPVELLGDAVPCTTLIGTVTPGAAAATGLPVGTPVAAGGIDAVGAALEAGLLHPGDGVAEMTGFSTVSMQPVPRGTTVPGMIHTRHCVPGTDLLLTAQVSTGALVDWLARLTGHASADLLDAEVPPIPTSDADTPGGSGEPGRPGEPSQPGEPGRSGEPSQPGEPGRSGEPGRPGGASRPGEAGRPGRVGLLPSFAGERTPTWDPAARGALVGLDLDVTPGDLLLAVFEGTALALRADLEAVAAALAGGSPAGGGAAAGGPLLALGGGARSRHWPQVKADVLGREVRVPASGHGAAFGAALLAGVACGRWATFDDLPPVSQQISASYRPDPARHAAYSRRLPLLVALRDHLPALTADLTAGQTANLTAGPTAGSTAELTAGAAAGLTDGPDDAGEDR